MDRREIAVVFCAGAIFAVGFVLTLPMLALLAQLAGGALDLGQNTTNLAVVAPSIATAFVMVTAAGLALMAAGVLTLILRRKPR